jgi:hypothetical protein
VAVVGIARQGIPQAGQGGRREAGAEVGLVRIVGGMAGGLGALASARMVGLPARGVGGPVRGGRIPVAGVMPRETGSRGAGQEATGRVAPGSPVVTGAGRGSRAPGAAQAEAGHLVGRPEGGRVARASPGTARGPGRTVERLVAALRGRAVVRVAGDGVGGSRGRGVVVTGTWPETGVRRRVGADRVGHSVRGMVAGKAARVLAGARLLPGAAAMAERVAKAPGHRAAIGLVSGPRGTEVPAAAIGTHGGHPAGGGWSFLRGLVLSSWTRRLGRSFGRCRGT